MMSRLINFLTEDLQKLEKAYTEIDNIIADRVHYIKEDTKISEHLETLEQFLSYWQHHHKKLQGVNDE
jgi:hypothetical protein